MSRSCRLEGGVDAGLLENTVGGKPLTRARIDGKGPAGDRAEPDLVVAFAVPDESATMFGQKCASARAHMHRPSGGDRYRAFVKGDQPQHVRPLATRFVDEVRVVLDQLGHHGRGTVAKALQRIAFGQETGHVTIDGVPDPRFGIVRGMESPQGHDLHLS